MVYLKVPLWVHAPFETHTQEKFILKDHSKLAPLAHLPADIPKFPSTTHSISVSASGDLQTCPTHPTQHKGVRMALELKTILAMPAWLLWIGPSAALVKLGPYNFYVLPPAAASSTPPKTLLLKVREFSGAEQDAREGLAEISITPPPLFGRKCCPTHTLEIHNLQQLRIQPLIVVVTSKTIIKATLILKTLSLALSSSAFLKDTDSPQK